MDGRSQSIFEALVQCQATLVDTGTGTGTGTGLTQKLAEAGIEYMDVQF